MEVQPTKQISKPIAVKPIAVRVKPDDGFMGTILNWLSKLINSMRKEELRALHKVRV